MVSTSIIQFSLLPWFAVIGCCFLVRVFKRNFELKPIKWIFYSLLGMNTAQALGYAIAPVNVAGAYIFADLYLICAYFMFATLLLFTFNLSSSSSVHTKKILAIPFTLTILHLSGLMVEGYRFEKNTLLHNDGPLAILFDLFALTTCLSVISTSIYNIRKYAGNTQITSKSAFLFLSFMPLLASFFTLVLFSRSDNPIPATLVSPCITIYTACVFLYLSSDKIINLRLGYRPLAQRLKLAYSVLIVENENGGHLEAKSMVEKRFILEAFASTEKNAGKTAQVLGINPSTVYAKLNDYGIKLSKKR